MIQGMCKKRYGIVIGKSANYYSAYVPDLPGCVVTGQPIEEVKSEIADPIRLHLEGLEEDGIAVPEPTTICEYVEA